MSIDVGVNVLCIHCQLFKVVFAYICIYNCNVIFIAIIFSIYHIGEQKIYKKYMGHIS